MKEREQAMALAQRMVGIGEQAGRRTVALITNMDVPLGDTAGNAIEVAEAVQTLKGEGPQDLTELCVHLAGNMLYLAERGSLTDCLKMAEKSLTDGSAYRKFYQMVERQGGDVRYLEDVSRFPTAPAYPVTAPEDGYLAAMQTEEIGATAALLGAGREKKEDAIDPAAGIRFLKKTGDAVRQGEPIALLYTNLPDKVEEAQRRYRAAVRISKQRPEQKPLLYARVSAEGVTSFSSSEQSPGYE